MLDLLAEQFNYHKSTKLFIQEASSLNLPVRDWNGTMTEPAEKKIVLTNTKTYGSMMFEFDHVDMSPENDVGGWNYKNESSGIDIIIIND
jgi:hypothetical protein